MACIRYGHCSSHGVGRIGPAMASLSGSPAGGTPSVSSEPSDAHVTSGVQATQPSRCRTYTSKETSGSSKRHAEASSATEAAVRPDQRAALMWPSPRS